jgi:WD40 repeat protein
VTGGFDGSVRMFRLLDGKQVRYFDLGQNMGPAQVSVAPDMRRAIRIGNPGPRTSLLQLRCQEKVWDWDPVARAPFLPDNQAVFLGGSTDPIWRVAGDRPQQTGQFNVNLTGLTAAHVSADGKRVAAVLGGNQVSVYDFASAERKWTWVAPAPFGWIRGVVLSPDGSYLITGNDDGTIHVIRLP